jgi:hypothetical protein
MPGNQSPGASEVTPMFKAPHSLRTLATSFLLAATLLAAAPADAHAPSNPSLVGNIPFLAGASRLIIRGTVTEVKMVNASTATGPFPFAFVTYDITDTLFPTTSELKTLTLRFMGGPNGRGGVMRIDGIPLFQVGDEDILFIDNNGTGQCPLVTCEFGRFRIFQGAVYEAHGAPVAKIDARKITSSGDGPPELKSYTFPAPSFDDLILNPEVEKQLGVLLQEKTLQQLREEYRASVPPSITIAEKASLPAPTVKLGLPVSSFLPALRSAIQALNLPVPKAFTSADSTKVPTLPLVPEVAPAR